MTKDEALKLALEALEKSHICPLLPDDCSEAITAIKEALAQPEHGWTSERIAGMSRLKEAQDKKLAQPEQEPVAWAKFSEKGNIIDLLSEPDDDYAPLYTTPPQRTWVGLTDEEIKKCWKAAIKLNSEKGNDITNQTFYHLVKIVEEELMEKNHG